MDNCLTYALRMARYGRGGNHLVIRKSRFAWFPHFSVLFELENGDIVRKEYVPINPTKRWIPPLFFKGKEVTTYYTRQIKTTNETVEIGVQIPV